jgi:hypothetical protein
MNFPFIVWNVTVLEDFMFEPEFCINVYKWLTKTQKHVFFILENIEM